VHGDYRDVKNSALKKQGKTNNQQATNSTPTDGVFLSEDIWPQ
jgi:hypothetical protein